MDIFVKQELPFLFSCCKCDVIQPKAPMAALWLTFSLEIYGGLKVYVLCNTFNPTIEKYGNIFTDND